MRNNCNTTGREINKKTGWPILKKGENRETTC